MAHQNKIAWVTGASSGIGAELVRELVEEGWIVAVTARNVEGLNALQAECASGHVHCYPGDVTDVSRMRDIVGQIVTHLGGLNLAILNAGVLELDGANSFSAETCRHVFDINLCGLANTLDPTLKYFQTTGQGHVVLMGSVAAYAGLPGWASYCASKAAVLSLAESLGAELRGTPIKIQVISPGFVKTPMTKEIDTGTEMVLSVNSAAKKIMRGLKSKRFEIKFPYRTAYLLRLVSMLPYWLSFRFLKDE